MVARFGLWPVYFVVLLAVGLARIPSAWWVIGAGYETLTRLIIALAVIYLLGWLRMIAWTLIPGAVIQFGRRLWFRHRGRRIRLPIKAITTIDVEQRPPPVNEAFILELADGAVYDMCPVSWDGAERIYSVVARRVRRARLRANRRLARAKRRAPAPTPDES
ncbi:hypothetical protein ENSA5_63770 [Enhygromyxa salina]|uniref:Uncharacterized protein n=2 Tax=Enhygromyxa salina TaxID=215803 RepID=A0A2S9XCJ0_9BACT|nr:hypothetical protein ENSA5_63770 [Enhygromyxa salina]